MSQDYKPVNDRTLSDVNQANRDAWDSGEFKHTFVDAWGEKEQNAVYTHKPPEGPLTKAQTEHAEKYKTKGPMEKSGRRKLVPLGAFAQRRVAITEHPENDSADVRHTPAEDESHQEYHTKKAAEGGEYVKKLLTTYGNKTSPSMTGNVAAEAASHGHKALSKSKANLKERKSEGTPKRNYFVVGRDVRHTPAGEQQLVRGGQVVSHHDEGMTPEEMERADAEKLIREHGVSPKEAKEKSKPVKVSGFVSGRGSTLGRALTGERDKLVDVPGNWPGKHADVEAAQNSAERAGGAANFGPNIPGPPESKDSLHGGGKTRTERALEVPSERPAQTMAEYEKIKYGGRMPTKAEREREREEHTDIKDEEPRRAVHLPRTSKRTWRRGEWS